MRLVSTTPEPLATIPYRAAGPGGRPRNALLDVSRLRVDELPAGLDALLVTGDLQGVVGSALLGVALADHLSLWSDAGLLPPPSRTGILLTGDLYSAPGADLRGASGPVQDVWLAFAVAGCPLITGVAGNHDEITAAQVAGFGTLLDGDTVEFGGVTIAGVSGIVGDPGRPLRRTETDFVARLGGLTADVLLLHEGPTGNHPDQRGRAALRTATERRPPPLTFCGHVHWDTPVAILGSGHLVNVDARAIVLTT
ncbi:metallophosphoesterase family protein [Actinoplanes couchii]|uniref:Calcineurin-like phosphoesterase domain-containing protein n=1 Tax=Actinoplanes couchii TaxID=403638 RepID=A0ABQ3XQ85_9ACTN|nr:metallophosphoesterase [Actinoplanes couchii]MDR6323017.1 hypothetical protein [Actinoplanes couchii]GID60692.1 hypothetical protein Aco03nite_090960 [Actinoplanes couchii]